MTSGSRTYWITNAILDPVGDEFQYLKTSSMGWLRRICRQTKRGNFDIEEDLKRFYNIGATKLLINFQNHTASRIITRCMACENKEVVVSKYLVHFRAFGTSTPSGYDHYKIVGFAERRKNILEA